MSVQDPSMCWIDVLQYIQIVLSQCVNKREATSGQACIWIDYDVLLVQKAGFCQYMADLFVKLQCLCPAGKHSALTAGLLWTVPVCTMVVGKFATSLLILVFWNLVIKSMYWM